MSHIRETDAELASAITPKSTGIRALVAYRHVERSIGINDVPSSVAELLGTEKMFLTGGEEPLGIQEPISGDPSSGTPSLYLVRYAHSFCTIISIRGGVDACFAALQQANGALATSDAIVDGKRFIYGLVGNDVLGVAVSVSASDEHPSSVTANALISNNAFIAPVPTSIDGTATLAITVHRQGAPPQTIYEPQGAARGPTHP